MKPKFKPLFITILPSPYQRDLFAALAARDDVELRVCYMESASPDSPWPEKSLRPFERIMPGFWIPIGGARVHWNWKLPNLSEPDFVILSTFTSVTGQWLMRRRLQEKRWLYWGERLRPNSGIKALIQRKLVSPIARSSGIVGIGRMAEEDYRQRFPDLPHFCVPYHCDLSNFFSINPSHNRISTPTFFFCGQIIRRKGVDVLLRAFDKLISAGIDSRLLLVGREAELPAFLQTVSSVARSKITYEGFQAPERLPEFFKKSDIFVLPSRHDGWGVVVNQALATGLPIIASNAVGAAQDFVENGVNGLCIRADDVESLYLAMKTLALNRNLICQWGKKSREKAFDLTPEAGANKWINVFEQLRSDQRARFE